MTIDTICLIAAIAVLGGLILAALIRGKIAYGRGLRGMLYVERAMTPVGFWLALLLHVVVLAGAVYLIVPISN